MGFLKETNEKIKQMNIFDMSLMKIGLISFGMIIGAHFDYFIKDNLLIFLLVWLICLFYLLWKFYRK